MLGERSNKLRQSGGDNFFLLKKDYDTINVCLSFFITYL